MLNELKSLELSAPSLSLMTSISQTQTSGLRNALKEKVRILHNYFNFILQSFKKKKLLYIKYKKFQKKCQTAKPIEENKSSDEMTVDEDVGSELDEDVIV